MNRASLTAAVIIGLAFGTSTGLAVKTASWTHEQPKDFLACEAENVVVSSLGEVTLGRKIEELRLSNEESLVVNALVRAGDGKIYAATGPGGIIYQLDGDDVSEFSTLPEGGTVLSLLFNKEGQLLAGTGGGESAKIYRIGGTGQAILFHELKEATYVWDLALGTQGEIYAATGTEGKLYVIDADGKESRELVDLKPKNLLCLAFGTDGMLYTGTDGDGLVVRVAPEGGNFYVMYDAKEEEISSIVVDDEGNIYAATAAGDQAKPGRTVADKPAGKPETQASNGDSTTTQPEDEESDSENEKPKKPTVVGKPVSAKDKAQGNAVYRIDTDGFVTEVFREPVMILDLAENDGTLYAATGDEGRIYAISPVENRITMIAKIEPSQATSLLFLPDGELVLGSANEVRLVRLSEGFAEEGTLQSKPIDAEQIVKWGRVHWKADVPEGTTLTVATRSSNVEDEESEGWDDWSSESNAATPQQIASPGARFLQYRLTLKSTVPEKTPNLRHLKITYVEENRPPQLKSFEAIPISEAAKHPKAPAKVKAMARRNTQQGALPEPDHLWAAIWEAEDPNKDDLIYNVYFRQAGDARWIRMAKEQEENFVLWDTRTVSDGKYELRVEAKDSKSNPPERSLSETRLSETITVDNTSPEITIQRMESTGDDSVTLQATFKDELSNVVDASYTLDSSSDWIPLAADDDIFDAPMESVTLTLTDLDAGEHRLALRVLDAQGNANHLSRAVEIAP